MFNLAKKAETEAGIILVCILFLLSVPLLAQNCGPTRKQFTFNDTLIYLNASQQDFTQNKYMLGWHWGSAKKLSEALFCSQEHTDPTWWLSTPDTLKDSVDLIVSFDSLVSSDHEIKSIFRDQGIQYEATNLISNDTMIQADVPHVNPSDTTNTVFGFREINGTMTDHGTLLLTSGQAGDTVLSKPWPDYGLYLIDTSSVIDSINGIRWYFQINLKYSGSSNLSDDSPILKIRLPYTCQDNIHSGYIKFSSLPCSTSGDLNSNYLLCDTFNFSNRGKYLNMQPAYDNLPEIIITRGMFPTNSEFVTIEAKFICNKLDVNDTNSNNPIMSAFDGCFSEGAEYRIKNLGIDVTYLDSELTDQVEINWVRICTPYTRNLLFGARDSNIVRAVQGALDAASTDPFKRKGIRPFRIYLRDEPGLSNFLGFKYFSDLVGNVFTTAQGLMFPRLFAAYTNAPEVWIEEDNMNLYLSAPYFKTDYVIDRINEWKESSIGSNRWKTLNLRNPYNRMCYPFPKKDTNAVDEYYDPTHSEYETSTRGGLDSVPNEPGILSVKDTSDAAYKIWLQARYGFLSKWELTTCRLAHGERHKNYFRCGSGFMFENRPWWGEVFVGSRFKTEKKDNNEDVLMCTDLRPKTGEEIRLATGLLTILGAKGLLYDKDAMNNEKLWTGLAFNQEDMRDNICTSSNEDFIFSPKAGCDFIDSNFVYYDFYVNAGLHVNETAQAMNVDANRIYIGMRSPRTEIYKLHKAIRRLEFDHDSLPGRYPADLMDLRLIAWHAKGLRAWDAPRSEEGFGYSGDSVLRQFIDIDSIKTAKIYNVDKNTDYSENYNLQRVRSDSVEWEALGTQDSSFYDLTFLIKNSYYQSFKQNQSNWRKDYYIGIQNRRTDPLVMMPYNGKFAGNDIGEIKFYSTAELYDSCQYANSSNYNRDISFYKDLWWKRFGSRVVRIPFKLQPFQLSQNTSENGFNLKFAFCVDEILSQDDDYNNKDTNWWRGSDYCDITRDYFLNNGNNNSLDVKLLPGEAKLLRVHYCEVPLIDPCPAKGDFVIVITHRGWASDTTKKYLITVVNNTDTTLSNIPLIVTDSTNKIIDIKPVIPNLLYNPSPIGIIKHSRLLIIDTLLAHGSIDVGEFVVPDSVTPDNSIYTWIDIMSGQGKCGGLDSVVFIYAQNLQFDSDDALNISSCNQMHADIQILDARGFAIFEQPEVLIRKGLTGINFNTKNYPDGEYSLIIKKSNSQTIQNYFEIKNHKGDIK